LSTLRLRHVHQEGYYKLVTKTAEPSQRVNLSPQKEKQSLISLADKKFFTFQLLGDQNPEAPHRKELQLHSQISTQLKNSEKNGSLRLSTLYKTPCSVLIFGYADALKFIRLP
jgi:hypothetical protein